MQFVQGIEKNEKDQAITKVIISLAKNLNLNVVAEGVETKPQLDFLIHKMCDEVQGFYYYRPMPAEEVEKVRSRAPAWRPKRQSGRWTRHESPGLLGPPNERGGGRSVCRKPIYNGFQSAGAPLAPTVSLFAGESRPLFGGSRCRAMVLRDAPCNVQRFFNAPFVDGSIWPSRRISPLRFNAALGVFCCRSSWGSPEAAVLAGKPARRFGRKFEKLPKSPFSSLQISDSLIYLYQVNQGALEVESERGAASGEKDRKNYRQKANYDPQGVLREMHFDKEVECKHGRPWLGASPFGQPQCGSSARPGLPRVMRERTWF